MLIVISLFQVCELYVAGFSFFVLPNSFVIHKGFKKPGKFHSEKEKENRKNWKIFINVSNGSFTTL